VVHDLCSRNLFIDMAYHKLTRAETEKAVVDSCPRFQLSSNHASSINITFCSTVLVLISKQYLLMKTKFQTVIPTFINSITRVHLDCLPIKGEDLELQRHSYVVSRNFFVSWFSFLLFSLLKTT
jgi:hypothetical protein